MRAPWAGVFGVAYAGLAVGAALIAGRDRQAATRLAGRRLALAAALAWALAGIAPLALLPDWNAWRVPLAGLWLGVALCGALGLVRPWLAVAFAAVRLAALLLAPAAPAVVTEVVPATTSTVSYARLTRLQRIAVSTRRALTAARPALPRGATVAYWSRLPIMEVALAPPKAFRVWYGDSTLAWRWYWDPDGATPADQVLIYDPEVASPAAVLEPEALRRAKEAGRRLAAGDLPGADSLFADAYRAQEARPTGKFTAWISDQRARIAYDLGAFDIAGRMNEMSRRSGGATADYLAMLALLAVEERQWALAQVAARRALVLEPANPEALRALELLRERAPGGAEAPRPR
jgi:hypothetical protein